LAWSLIGAEILTRANMFIPRTEKRYRRRKRRPPTLIKAGRVTMKVVNISFKLLAFFIRRKIRKILKDLTIVVEGPTSTPDTILSPIPIRVPITIEKSNLFHPSLKYF
jgi:hypothetical protein